MADTALAKPKRKLHRYSAAEIDRALIALAAANGNARAASRELASDNIKVPFQTLAQWKRTKHEQYSKIRAEILPAIKAHMAELHMEHAEARMQAAAKVLDQLVKNLGEIPARDLAGSLRNLDVGAGVHTDKAALYRGEPTEIRESRSLKDIERALAAKGFRVEVVNGTATEVTGQSEEGREEAKPPAT